MSGFSLSKANVAAFVLGALSLSLPSSFLLYQWAEKQASNAFLLGVSSGEAGYIKLFYSRVNEGKSVNELAELSICIAGREMKSDFDKANIMTNPAYVSIPDAIRYSAQYRKENGITRYEECYDFVREKFSSGTRGNM